MSTSSSSLNSSSSSSTSTLGSDSDDHFIENVLIVMPRPRNFRNRHNPMEMYDKYEFKRRYRLEKESVIHICDIIIGNNLESKTLRNKPLTALDKVLTALRFYATGSFQHVLADHTNISQPTVSRIIKVVTNTLATFRPEFIKMPSTVEERRRIQQEFYAIRRFPCILGAIDGSHIKIQSSGGEISELYRNRKGWFSYNVQCICDAKLRYLDIIARWPGSVHDSTIFYDSPLRIDFENNLYPDCYLLGDSAYPLKTYLFTPVLNPTTEEERKYNDAHIKTRNSIERAFGVWKRRFPCLSVGMRLKKQTVLHVIVAAAVFHNICILLKDISLEENNTEHQDDDDNDELEQNIAENNVSGNNFRNRFIHNSFRR